MIDEEQIWNYLDGRLSNGEKAALEQAIASDLHAKALFQEISGLNDSLKSETLLLNPSASFTDRVMAGINMTPAYAQPAKFPYKLFLLFASPVIFVIVAFAVLLAYYHVPLTYSLPVHIRMPNFKSFQLYFVVADILLLAFFIEQFSEYRFNRKTLFA
jgi:hypothetical protein